MRNFILGTDWWTDCDDAVAVRLLTRNVADGKINLLGVCINACMDYSVASLKSFIEADGIKNIPIGIDLEATDFYGTPPYQKGLAERFNSYVTNDSAENGVRLYRRLLSECEGRAEILEIGFLQVVSAVLKSEADDISPLSGIELFKEKVSKIWVMAGKWDEEGGKEHNFAFTQRSRTAAKEFCELCPVPMTFLGFEVGHGAISGKKLSPSDHLYGVLRDHGSENGRDSWDPMLTLMALIGDEEKAGYDVVTGTASVDAETGANYFKKSLDGPHKFVVKKYPDSFYTDMIDEIIS